MTTVFQFYILLEFSLCQGSRDILVCKSTRNGGRVLRMFTSSELFFSFAFFRLLSLGIYIFFSCPSEFGNVYMKDEETLYLYSPLSMELNAKCGPSIENGDWKQMVSIKNRDKHKKRRMQICVFEQDLRHRREGAGCRNARRRCTRRNNPSRLSLWPCLSICISEVIVYF